MMGTSHAIYGAATTAVVMSVTGFSPVQVVPAVIIGAGAAIIPDIDHPNSHVTKTMGLVTKLFAIGMNKSAGHRGAAHSLAFVALIGWLSTIHAAAPFVAVFCIATGWNVLGIASGRKATFTAILLVPLGGWLLLWLGWTPWWLWIPVITGMLSHLLSDMPFARIDLFWPIGRRGCGVDWFDVGGFQELFCLTSLLAINAGAWYVLSA